MFATHAADPGQRFCLPQDGARQAVPAINSAGEAVVNAPAAELNLARYAFRSKR